MLLHDHREGSAHNRIGLEEAPVPESAADGRGERARRPRTRRYLAATTLAAFFGGFFPSGETFTESAFGLGSGLFFSNTAFSPYLATMRFLVSRPPVK
jgi:hypothetical protein